MLLATQNSSGVFSRKPIPSNTRFVVELGALRYSSSLGDVLAAQQSRETGLENPTQHLRLNNPHMQLRSMNISFAQITTTSFVRSSRVRTPLSLIHRDSSYEYPLKVIKEQYKDYLNDELAILYTSQHGFKFSDFRNVRAISSARLSVGWVYDTEISLKLVDSHLKFEN